MDVNAPGGRTARPFPSAPAARPTPRFSVVFIKGMCEAPSRAPRAQNSSGCGGSRFWLVREIGAQPPFDLREGHSRPRGVVLRLVAPDPADGEVAGLRMRQVDAADAGGRRGRKRLCQLDAEVLRGQEPEERLLFAVIGAGRVTVSRADAPEALGDQLVAREPRA